MLRCSLSCLPHLNREWELRTPLSYVERITIRKKDSVYRMIHTVSSTREDPSGDDTYAHRGRRSWPWTWTRKALKVFEARHFFHLWNQRLDLTSSSRFATFRCRSTLSVASFVYHRYTQSNGGVKKEALRMGFYGTYYAVGFPTFLVVLVTLYLLFTGTSLLVRSACLFVLVSAQVQAGWKYWIMLMPCKNCRIGRGFQCWPLPWGDKSIYMGFDGYWIVHWVECIRSGLVSAFVLCGKLRQSQ